MVEMQKSFETTSPPQMTPATDEQIIQYLRYAFKLGEIATQAEQQAFILENCDRLGITVSDEEWQAAGNEFRLKHKLLGVKETQNWLTQQRLSVDDWSQGVKIQLFAKKLKERLFGFDVDSQYLQNRERFRRVALSQIIVAEATEAMEIAKTLREGEAYFCILAVEHSKGKKSHENGGFLGVRFLRELTKEIQEAITEAKEGEIVGPIQTKLGYHILRVEKWYQLHLNEQLREQLIDALFQGWLNEQ
jgi:hypothetical protein